MPKLCSIGGCAAKHYARGTCRNHYMQLPDVKAKKKSRMAKWHAEHAEAQRQRSTDWHANNKEVANAKSRKWNAENKDKIRAAYLKWRANNPEGAALHGRKIIAQARDHYIRQLYDLPKDVPEVVIETYRVILQIKRELRS